jgi:protein TonB
MGYAFSRKRAVILAGLLAATVYACSMANAQGSPVVIHRKIGSKACELVQRGALVVGKEFAWIEIEGEKSEIYSPELGPGDYLSASPEISGRAAKDAHKSGFELKREGSIPGDMPTVLGLRGNGTCPDLQNAISEVEQSQTRRRSQLQAKIYRPGYDDVVAATPLKDQPSQPDQSVPPKTSDAKQAAKYHGTVLLDVVIGIDGAVTQSKIARSANPDLDKKAAEQVSRWKFLPARKKGLPVPSVMPVEINFHLY